MFNDPAIITGIAAFVGVLLAKFVYPFLEKLVGKTETKTDDEFLEAIKGMIDGAIAKKKTK